jgi:hypothetical protein
MIEGVVTDAYTNAAIPMTEVSVGTGSTWFEHDLGSTITDANGRYSIQVPVSDHYQFIVHTKEIERGQYRFYDHCWNRKTVMYAPNINLNFDLEPAGSILIKMFDLNGKQLGVNSMEGSLVKDVSLRTITGEGLGNRTNGHAKQPYGTGDEDVILLSPEAMPTVVSSEVSIPSLDSLSTRFDNEGQGFTMRAGELLVLNLNYQTANATFQETEAVFAPLLNETAALRESTSEVFRKLNEAHNYQLQGDDANCAVQSNAALLEILNLRNEMWLKIPLETEHPRLLFTRSDLARLKEKVKSGFPEEAWKSILDDSNKLLSLPLPQPPPSASCPVGAGACWYNIAESAIRNMQNLAFAYMMTGRTEYAAKAKDIMWALLSWPSWIDPGEEAQLNPGVPGLLAGHLTEGASITYDWLFDYLKPEERTFIREKVGEKGAEPLYQASISGTAWWHNHDHSNYYAVIHGGMGLAGLAFLGEVDNASRWVGLATSRIWRYFDSGGRNGGWGEGLHYWAYGLAVGIPFADALRRVTGLDLYKSNFLTETLYFPIYLMTPTPKGHVNFGDSWSEPWLVSWIAALTLRLSSEYGNGYGRMLFNMLQERYGNDMIMGSLSKERFFSGAFPLIWYDESVKPKPLDDLPLSRLFEGLGWVVVRSGWGPDDTLMAFKSGPNWAHSHADQNNFIFEAYGEPLIVDLGAGLENYNAAYDAGPTLDYHQASIGHNVVLFDGQGQLDPRSGWAQPPNGKIITYQTYAEFEYVVGDAYHAYSIPAKFIRQIVFVQHRFLVILDSVEAPQPMRFQWLLHTEGGLKTAGNEIRVTKGTVDLVMKFLLPESFESHVYYGQNRQTGWATGEPVSRLEVSTQEPALSTTFLTVLYPMKSSEGPPRISLVQNATTWTVKVEDNAPHYLYFDSTTSPPSFLGTATQMTTTTISTSHSTETNVLPPSVTTIRSQSESATITSVQSATGLPTNELLVIAVVTSVAILAAFYYTRRRKK